MARRISSGARTARLAGRAQSPHRHTFRICARRAHPRTRQGADRPAARRAARAVDGGRARLAAGDPDVTDRFRPRLRPDRAGIVSSLARPEANLTGVLHYEAGIVGKWLAMLKEMSPRLARVAVLANSKTTAFDYFQRSAQGAASSLGVEVIPSASKAPPISSAPSRNSHACPIAACCCRRMPRPFCIRISSSGSRSGTGCPRFIRCRSLSRPVA